jgi:hypothetical protein
MPQPLTVQVLDEYCKQMFGRMDWAAVAASSGVITHYGPPLHAGRNREQIEGFEDKLRMVSRANGFTSPISICMDKRDFFGKRLRLSGKRQQGRLLESEG